MTPQPTTTVTPTEAVGVRVPVHCTVGTCRAEWFEHIHKPLPCTNGKSAQHHDFTPPKTVTIDILGQARRIKVVVLPPVASVPAEPGT